MKPKIDTLGKLIKTITETGIIGAIGDGISIQNTDFRILYQNKVHQEYFGNHVGEFCYSAYGLKDKVCEGCPLPEVCGSREPLTKEREAVTGKGLKYFEITTSPLIDPEGNIQACIELLRDITGRKQAEQAVLRSEQDWEDTFNTITDMITVHDEDYNIIRANRAAKSRLKLPDSKAKCFRYYHGTEGPPEGCPSCNCLKTGKPATFELFEPHLNMYIEIRAIARFNGNNRISGLIHVVRDITERKKVEDAIRNAKIEWEMTFDNAQEMIVLVDRELNIIRCNRSFIEFSKKPVEELIGKGFTGFFSSDLGKVEYRKGTGRTEIRTDDGRWIYLSFHPISDVQGVITHSVIIGTDITELKEIQQRLTGSEKEMRERVEDLEKFYKMSVGREVKMKELKERISKLEAEVSRYRNL